MDANCLAVKKQFLESSVFIELSHSTRRRKERRENKLEEKIGSRYRKEKEISN